VVAVHLQHLELTLFLALYLLQVAVLVVLIQQLLVLQVDQVAVQIVLAVMFLAAQLVKEYLVRVTLVGCLGLVQTIQVEAVVVLEQLV
jgi:hypothetical protein